MLKLNVLGESGTRFAAWVEANLESLEDLSKKEIVKLYRSKGLGSIGTTRGYIVLKAILDNEISNSVLLTDKDKERIREYIRVKQSPQRVAKRLEDKKRAAIIRAVKRKRPKWSELSPIEKERVKEERRVKRDKAQKEVDERLRQKLLKRETEEDRDRREKKEHRKKMRLLGRLEARKKRVEERKREEKLRTKRKAKLKEAIKNVNGRLTNENTVYKPPIELREGLYVWGGSNLLEPDTEIIERFNTPPVMVTKSVRDKIRADKEEADRLRGVSKSDSSWRWLDLSKIKKLYKTVIPGLLPYHIQALLVKDANGKYSRRYTSTDEIIGKQFLVASIDMGVIIDRTIVHEGVETYRVRDDSVKRMRLAIYNSERPTEKGPRTSQFTYNSFIRHLADALKQYREYSEVYYNDLGKLTGDFNKLHVHDEIDPEDIHNKGERLTMEKKFLSSEKEMYELLAKHNITLNYLEIEQYIDATSQSDRFKDNIRRLK